MPSGSDPLFFGNTPRARTRVPFLPILLTLLIALAGVFVAAPVLADDGISASGPGNLPVTKVAGNPWNGPTPEGKVDLCHPTSDKGHWNRVRVSVNSARFEGHKNHQRWWGAQDFYASDWQIANKTCAAKPTPPVEPPPPVGGGGIEASGYVCGDPRVVLTTYADKRQPISVRFVRAKDGKRVTVTRIHTPSSKTYSRFWVKGRTMFKVFDKSGDLIWSTWTGPRQNIGSCTRTFTIANG